MRPRVVLVLATLLSLAPSIAAVTPPELLPCGMPAAAACSSWWRAHDSEFGADVGTAVAVDPSGRIFAGGTLGTGLIAPRAQDASVVAYGSDGTLAWVHRFDPPGRGQDVVRDVAVADASVFVAAFAKTGGPAEATRHAFVVAALDAATGEERWRDVRPGDAIRIQVSDDGARVFVAGRLDQGTNADAGIVAYDARAGDIVWSATLHGSHDHFESFGALGLSADGSRLFAAGGWYEQPPGRLQGDAAVVAAYDARDGSLLWVSSYRHPDSLITTWHQIALASDGVVCAAGHAPRSSPTGVVGSGALACFDAETGALLWGADTPVEIASGMRHDGARVVVLGSARSEGGTQHVPLAAAHESAGGEVAWTHAPAEEHYPHGALSSAVPGPRGGLVLAGASVAPNYDQRPIAREVDAATGALLTDTPPFLRALDGGFIEATAGPGGLAFVGYARGGVPGDLVAAGSPDLLVAWLADEPEP